MDLQHAYALLNAVQFAAWYTPKDRTCLDCLPIAIESLEEIGRGLAEPEYVIGEFLAQLQHTKDNL